MDDESARCDEVADLGPQEAEDAMEIQEFWEVARVRADVAQTAVVTGMSAEAAVPPRAWAFSDTRERADELLACVLAETKTAMSTLLAELERVGEPVPRNSELSIVLDGEDRPRALVRTTHVDVVAFCEVTAEQVAAEGEGDGGLESWRKEHEAYYRQALDGTGATFSEDLPVVFEHFELLWPRESDI